MVTCRPCLAWMGVIFGADIQSLEPFGLTVTLMSPSFGGPSSPSPRLAQLSSLWSSRAGRERSCFPAGPSGSEFQGELEGRSCIRHHLTPWSSGGTLPVTLQMRRVAQGCFVMATSPWDDSGERYLGGFSYVVAHAGKSLTRKICVYENPRHSVPAARPFMCLYFVGFWMCLSLDGNCTPNLKKCQDIQDL